MVKFATAQEGEEPPDTGNEEVVDSEPQTPCPKRSAAEKARDQIKVHSMYEQGELDC